MNPDIWVIPKGAQHVGAAHLFLNYVFRPEVNALLIETIGYTPVHKGVLDLLPEDMLDWPGVVLTDEIRAIATYPDERAFIGRGLELREQIWEELKR